MHNAIPRTPAIQYALVVLWLLLVLSLLGCEAASTPMSEVTVVSTVRPTQTALVATKTPPPTLTPVPTRTPRPTPTPMPSLTPTPTPLPGTDLLAFETYRDGNGEIYLINSRSGDLINLTRHPADDRAPAWRPDGQAIAFESHRDGNWEIYVLDLADGSVTRLTENPAYDGKPSWSPDGAEIAFESYRDGNLEIYAMAATENGNEQSIRRLTEDDGGDYGPAWRPDGVEIAFTSWRDGNKEIYSVPAVGGEARNLTQNPADDESPAWTPDGTALAFVSWRDVDADTGNRNAEIYQLILEDGAVARLTDNSWPDLDPSWDLEGRLVSSVYDPGEPFETYDPFRPGDFHLYRAVADNSERLTATNWDDRHAAPAPAQIAAVDVVAGQLPPLPDSPAPDPTLAPNTLAEVIEVPSIFASFAEQPIRVNELVSLSLIAWQQDVLQASGWDFMRDTLGSWRTIEQERSKALYTYDYGYLSWHKSGRALDLALEYKVDGANQMLLVREDLGENVYWRMYLRAAAQDGSQGEPLKDYPWRHWWHIVPGEEPEAYAAGGKRIAIPSGYYVDVTAIAKRHGWERIACYAIQDDYHWQTDSNGTEYWHYERADGLIWWEAMSQLYPPQVLEQSVGWDAAMSHAQSEEMVRSKGVPTPVP